MCQVGMIEIRNLSLAISETLSVEIGMYVIMCGII